jgi:hypothetical protein
VRLVREHESAYDSQCAGASLGLTTEERQWLPELERENSELRRGNDILRKPSAYFDQAELLATTRPYHCLTIQWIVDRRNRMSPGRFRPAASNAGGLLLTISVTPKHCFAVAIRPYITRHLHLASHVYNYLGPR